MTPDNKNVRCITKPGLTRVNNSSIRVGYNRTLDPNEVATLPEDTIYIVTPIMVHEHIGGKLVDPHMRCSIYAGPEHTWMMLDMSFEYFIRAEITKAAAAMQEKQTAAANEEKHDE